MDAAQPDYKPGDIAWVLTSTALVFLMCPGLGLFYSGMARAKNALSLMYLTMIAVAVVSVQWFFWGFSLTFSSTGGPFIGNLDHFVGKGIGWNPHPSAPSIPSSAFFMFQMIFAAITPALAYGASAERMRIGPSILFLFIWSTLVYDVVTYWVWGPNGWLTKMGVMDYAGGTPVHISSGAAAVAYALVIGKRKDYNHPSTVPHNVSFVFIGTGLLWFGWYGFNGGSALAANARGVQTIINSHLAACVGGLVWVLLDYRHAKKMSLIGFCTGAIAGLATITPGSGFVSGPSALVFGLLGGGLCNLGVSWKSRYHFDDALDVFAVHYIGGLLGLVLTGIFAQQSVMALGYPVGATDVPLGGALDGNWNQLLVQLAAIGSVTLWSFVVTYGILYLMNCFPGIRLRLKDHEEEMGTDMAQMGETAYGFLPLMISPYDEEKAELRLKPVGQEVSTPTETTAQSSAIVSRRGSHATLNLAMGISREDQNALTTQLHERKQIRSSEKEKNGSGVGCDSSSTDIDETSDDGRGHATTATAPTRS